MARYHGRHRTPERTDLRPTAGVAATHAEPRPEQTAPSGHRSTLHAAPHASTSHAAPKGSPWLRRPLLAGGLALALGGSALAYADSVGDTTDATFVIGNLAAAEVNEQAVADAIDARASASALAARNDLRTQIDIAAQQKAVAEQKAREAAAAAKAKAAAAAKAKADAAAKAKAVAAAKADAAAKAKAVAAAKAKADYDRFVAKAKANPQAAAAAIASSEYGWGSGQMSCLTRLWIGESDWRWWAENSSSGAYGIPQALPGRKMATFGADWRTNPVTQIKWGLWYIHESYGTPCSALSFWNAQSPHWY